MRSLYPAIMMMVVMSLACMAGCDDGDDAPCCNDDAPAICGDGHCSFSEWGICSDDCPICGDGECGDGETITGCALDCRVCGNGTCDGAAEMEFCVTDCYQCIVIGSRTFTPCEPEYCGDDLSLCDVCGDGECGSVEMVTGCPDCYEPICEDGYCNYWEYGTCPVDCEICGDRTCNENELSLGTCPEDCAICGDDVCEGGEIDFCNIDCMPF
ncbi:MAG: hypothetical protein V1738_05040 [Patescibacteria group bacterium]